VGGWCDGCGVVAAVEPELVQSIRGPATRWSATFSTDECWMLKSRLSTVAFDGGTAEQESAEKSLNIWSNNSGCENGFDPILFKDAEQIQD